MQKHWFSFELQNDIKLLDTQTEQLDKQFNHLSLTLTKEKLSDSSMFKEASSTEYPDVELTKLLEIIRAKRDILKSTSVDSKLLDKVPSLFNSFKSKCSQITNEGTALSL